MARFSLKFCEIAIASQKSCLEAPLGKRKMEKSCCITTRKGEHAKVQTHTQTHARAGCWGE